MAVASPHISIVALKINGLNSEQMAENSNQLHATCRRLSVVTGGPCILLTLEGGADASRSWDLEVARSHIVQKDHVQATDLHYTSSR